jgi:7-cyano-7-deazaguanine synthase
MNNNIKAVILHSGGLDSTVCLLLAKAKLSNVLSLGINYGQRHSIELIYADEQCRKFNIPRRVISVTWEKPKLQIPTERKATEIGREISPAFLPGRNVIFLALACAEAAGIGANEVWIGINSVDFSGYPDCTPEFLEAYKDMLGRAIPGGPIIQAPLLKLSKPQIAQEAYLLGIHQGDTWSCYQPVITTDGIQKCRVCDACVLHEYAWKNAFSNTEHEK